MTSPHTYNQDWLDKLRGSGITIEKLRKGKPPRRSKLWSVNSVLFEAAFNGGLSTYGAAWAGDGNLAKGFEKGWGTFVDPSKCTDSDMNDPDAAKQTQSACMISMVMDNLIFSKIEGLASSIGSYFPNDIAASMSETAIQTIGKGASETEAESIATMTASKELPQVIESAVGEIATEAVSDSAMGPAGYAVMALQIVGMVLDVFDPEEYSSFLTDNNINAIVAGMAATHASNTAASMCHILDKIFEGPMFKQVAKSTDPELCQSMSNLKQCITNKYRSYPRKQHPLIDFYDLHHDPAIKPSLIAYMIDYLRWTTPGSNTYNPPAINDFGQPIYSKWMKRKKNSRGIIIGPLVLKSDISKYKHSPLEKWYFRNIVSQVQSRSPSLAAGMVHHPLLFLSLSITGAIMLFIVLILLVAIACNGKWY